MLSSANAVLEPSAIPVGSGASVDDALSGGDDYELCFTAPAARRAEVEHLSSQLGLPLTRIGKIVAGRGCIVHDTQGQPIDIETEGYDHFR